MTVRLNVMANEDETEFTVWWSNFLDSLGENSTFNYPEELKKHGGDNLAGPWIEFEADELATLFILKYS